MEFFIAGIAQIKNLFSAMPKHGLYTTALNWQSSVFRSLILANLSIKPMRFRAINHNPPRKIHSST